MGEFVGGEEQLNPHGVYFVRGHADIFDPVLILQPDCVFIDEGARIDSFADIRGGQGVHIGKYVHVGNHCSVNIGGGVTEIGDYVGIGPGAKILSGSNMPEGLSMSAAAPKEMQVVHRGRTVIGRYAFVGTNAVVMPDVTIGDYSVLGAGAVATKDIPPGEIWAGVPARKIGVRDEWLSKSR